VDEACGCGRKSLRFELLGRFGDIFKMGPLFNYSEFAGILETYCDYGGELQLILDTTRENKQQITLRINKNAGMDNHQVREIILDHYAILAEMVRDDDLIELIIDQIDGGSFKKIESSGKLHKIIDHRNPAS
jgi:hypothetical protein